MSKFFVTRQGVVITTLAALGVIAAVAQPAEKATAASKALACDIEVKRFDGMVEVQAVVSAPRPTTGTYSLRVAKSGDGSANINQAGEFSVGQGPSVVSSVSLGGSGSFTARLAVSADGQHAGCSEKLSGSL